MYNRLNNKNISDETSTDESQTETSEFSSAPISGKYGSTPVQDKSVPQFYVPWCGLVFYVMGFFGFFCALLVRECLSVAIVAMVNQTAVGHDTATTNISESQCPRDPAELRIEGGEFNWDRNQQGVVLAAFYYGYGVTQVLYVVNISGEDTKVRQPHLSCRTDCIPIILAEMASDSSISPLKAPRLPLV